MARVSLPAEAVSVSEHEQLVRDLGAVREQLEATNEVLAAMGRSGGDPDTVLTTVVENARRLCRSQGAQLFLLENGIYRLIKATGLNEESIAFIGEHPMPLDRDSLIGRVGLDRRTQQIPDVLADPDYGRRDLQRVTGVRSTVAAPLLLDDRVVGALNVWRDEVRPFDERECAIVSAFSVQAAMAVNSVRLVQELEARRSELAGKVEELEALREVGEAVGSSLDVDHVLSMIVEYAVELSGTDGGSIMEFSEWDRCFIVRNVYRTERRVIEALRTVRIGLDETLVGRAARERRPLPVEDLDAVDLDPHLQVLRDAGWRSLVALPMLREGQVVGALVVRRKRTGGFTPESVRLLETFASQSALALVNAQLYRELKVQSAALEQASRHKSEFLASMSHELRTPLNAVLGFSEVLLERMFGDINERQEEYLRDIHGSGRHLLDLLNEILDLSKVEAGRMDLDDGEVDLPALLEEAAAMVRERASLHDIELAVEVGEGVTTLHTDGLRLKQVVLNLLSNAVKFTQDGGSVVVRAALDGTGVSLTVSDTGIGVAEEDRERIFESFQQGGRRGSHEEGTGLGLTLSRRLVELLGGQMWLESEVGTGSTFGVWLPAVDAPTPVPGTPAVRDVVVIEDDRRSLDLLTAYLSGASVRVTAARDGQAGLDAVRRTRPCAVLLDILLPGVDGWAVLRALKADPATRGIPVVVVSMLDERARGSELGAAAYLVKPVARADLLAALESAGALAPAPRPVPEAHRRQGEG